MRALFPALAAAPLTRRAVRRDRFNILDEGFLDMPSFSLHPQTLLMESIWLSRWYERLLKMEQELREASLARGEAPKETIFIADRSPYSAEFYAKSGNAILGPLIKEQLKSLRVHADIHVYTIHIKVDEEILWSRIQGRLEKEPHRRNYNEHSREWMDTTLAFYNNKQWDFVVHNNTTSPIEVMHDVIRQVSLRTNRFHSASPVKVKLTSREETQDEDMDLGPNSPPKEPFVSLASFGPVISPTKG